ncbi:MAG: hypothetical protein QXU34_03210 [Ignisphaera sp.]
MKLREIKKKIVQIYGIRIQMICRDWQRTRLSEREDVASKLFTGILAFKD